MDNKLLTSFIAVVEYKSFSKAARALYLSQSTISTHLKSLEDILSVQLLLRSTRGITTTKAGKTFYNYAKNIVDLENQAIHSMDIISSSNKGEIHILSSTVPSQYFLGKMISDFRKTYPNVIFKVEQKNSHDVIHNLDKDWYDFAIVGTPYESDDYLVSPIYDDHFSLAIPSGFPLPADNSTAEIAKYLLKQPLIFRSSGSATQTETENLVKKFGLSLSDLNIVAYLGDPQSVVNAVYHEMGVAFVSSLALEVYACSQKIQTIDIPSDFFHRQFYLLVRKNFLLPPKQELFYQYLLSNY